MAGFLKPIKTKRVEKENEEKESVEEVEPLSPTARMFHSKQMNCCIIAVMGCKTSVDVEIIKEGLKQTLIKHPRFSSKLVYDSKDTKKPVAWVRTKVNVDDHIIVPDIDPINIVSPEEFIDDYVTKVAQTPMDFSKPLWDIHILHVRTSEAEATAVFRIHHSVGDGISLMSLVLACTRKTSNPNELPTLPVPKKKKSLFTTRNSISKKWRYFALLLFIFKVLWNTLVDLALFVATAVFLKDTKTPLKGEAGTERAPKRFVHRNLNLDDIKLVKDSLNMTINDVILGITQAGLSRYLNKEYGKAAGELKPKENYLPKHIRLRSTLLMNLRPTSRLEGLAEMMKGDSRKKWKWGNSIAYIVIPFHIGLRKDPLSYIRDAKATIDRKKQSLEAQLTYSSAKVVLKTLGREVAASLIYRAITHTTLSFSNVVGPLEEISFYGHPLVYLAPSVYGHPQALTIHFQSYMDKMTLSMAADKNVISDPHKLCDEIEESLKLAKNAVTERKLIKP